MENSDIPVIRGEPDRHPMLGLGGDLLEENRVGYGASQGGYSPPWPGLSWAREGFLGAYPTPSPLWRKFPFIPLTGDHFSTPNLMVACPGNRRGLQRGLGIPKRDAPATGHTAGRGGVMGLRPTNFGAPVAL